MPRLVIFKGISKPVYEQIFDYYKYLVVSGQLTPGDYLPSVRDTGRNLNINPMTVSKSYGLLKADGFVKLNEITRTYEVTQGKVLSLPDRRKLIEETENYLKYIKSCLELDLPSDEWPNQAVDKPK